MNRFSRGRAGSSLGVGPEPARPLRAHVLPAGAASSPPASLRASQSLRSQRGVRRPSAALLVPVLDSGCRHHGLLCWEGGAGLELPLLGRPWSQPRCCGGKDTTSLVVRSCAETPSVHCRVRVVLQQLWVVGGPRGTCAQPDPWNLRV
ncbi:unnamed protein product [Rangifer tarandus platyrhynchus]|uniref:Uncharacterized protein n=1 Tax=Rangifer tarandus platyrhynchus TaxID=3082113 RepID=A0ABN8ZX24_RANTA|nr:unnamed protein product [Rangifer tarandus platyrhynchus]